MNLHPDTLAFWSAVVVVLISIAIAGAAIYVAKLFLFVKKWEIHLFVALNGIVMTAGIHLCVYLWPLYLKAAFP